jgi:uncharacterized protein (DUF362 family)
MGREKVLLRSVPDYNPYRIRQVIQEGLAEFGLSGAHHSDIAIKPNVVMAHHRIAPSPFTRSEFLDGLIQALHDGRDPAPKITITEKCGAGIPTSRMFRRAGYFSLKKRHNIKLRPIEEAEKKKIPLQKGQIHSHITTSREIVDNDFLVYTPKLKSNSLTHGLTAAIKLNVGILCDGERMWNHTAISMRRSSTYWKLGIPTLSLPMRWKSPWEEIISRNMGIRWALSSWPQIPWLMIRSVPTCFT